jgi:hypothetical protein
MSLLIPHYPSLSFRNRNPTRSAIALRAIVSLNRLRISQIIAPRRNSRTAADAANAAKHDRNDRESALSHLYHLYQSRPMLTAFSGNWQLETDTLTMPPSPPILTMIAHRRENYPLNHCQSTDNSDNYDPL